MIDANCRCHYNWNKRQIAVIYTKTCGEQSSSLFSALMRAQNGADLPQWNVCASMEKMPINAIFPLKKPSTMNWWQYGYAYHPLQAIQVAHLRGGMDRCHAVAGAHVQRSAGFEHKEFQHFQVAFLGCQIDGRYVIVHLCVCAAKKWSKEEKWKKRFYCGKKVKAFNRILCFYCGFKDLEISWETPFWLFYCWFIGGTVNKMTKTDENDEKVVASQMISSINSSFTWENWISRRNIGDITFEIIKRGFL